MKTTSSLEVQKASLGLFPMRFVLALVLACAIGGLVALDSLVVRAGGFRHAKNCFYQLMLSAPRDMKVLIVGSSRMWCGIDPDVLAQQFGVSQRQVVNLGHPGYFPDFDYFLLDDLLPDRRISLVLVDANIEPRRTKHQIGISDRSYAQPAIHFVTYRQILANMAIAGEQPLVLRVYDGLNLLVMKIESALRFSLGRQLDTVLSPDPNEPTTDRSNICWLQNFEKPLSDQQLKKMNRKRNRIEADFYAQHSNWFEYGFYESTLFVDKDRQSQIDYLRGMVKFAKEHGAQLVFVYQPGYLGWPPGPDFTSEFNAEIGAPLLVPDKRLLQSLQSDGYRDNAHLTAQGRMTFTTWLAQELMEKGLWTRE